LDRHLRGSKRLDLTGVAWPEIGSYPLTDAEGRGLTYMMDIEAHTMLFFRDLLAARVVGDPELTAVLPLLVYEEVWHGEALSGFLGEAGVRMEPDRAAVGWDDAYPSRGARMRWVRGAVGRRGMVGQVGMLAASALIPEFPTIHMTWGAVNEL